MFKKQKQIINYILLAIFALYYANICFFYHTHIINGVTIVHSHIHSNSHAQAGTHSESELTLISTLSTFQTFQAALCFIGLGFFLFLQAIVYAPCKNNLIHETVPCISLRAPPSFY